MYGVVRSYDAKTKTGWIDSLNGGAALPFRSETPFEVDASIEYEPKLIAANVRPASQEPLEKAPGWIGKS